MKPSERIKEIVEHINKEWGNRALMPKPEWVDNLAILQYLDELSEVQMKVCGKIYPTHPHIPPCPNVNCREHLNET